MRLTAIEGSPSLEIVNLVLQRRAKGEKIVSLAVGDPSFSTPKEIIDAAYESMKSGEVHYTSSYGIPELREAIKNKVRKKNRIQAEIENTIFLTTKLSVYAVLVALSEEAKGGEFEVLTPDPGYFYSEPIVLSGGTPVRYRLGSEDFWLDLEEIKRKSTNKTRAIFVNSPSNPTSRVHSKDELEGLYEFCQKNRIFIISDEAYEDLVYGKEHVSVGSFEESQPDIVVSLFSLSKSYSMTGWRAGYVVANERVVHLINKFLEHTVTCFPPFIQRASAFALKNCENIIASFREQYERRRNLTMQRIKEIEGLEVNHIEGAFYAFPKFNLHKMNSIELARNMLEREGVAVLPGLAFGPAGEGHIRISFSGSIDEIEEGLTRVKTFFSKEHMLAS